MAGDPDASDESYHVAQDNPQVWWRGSKSRSRKCWKVFRSRCGRRMRNPRRAGGPEPARRRLPQTGSAV